MTKREREALQKAVRATKRVVTRNTEADTAALDLEAEAAQERIAAARRDEGGS